MGNYQTFVRQYAQVQVGKTRIGKCSAVFSETGLWDRILEHLVKETRQKAVLSAEPTQALIDSQSVIW